MVDAFGRTIRYLRLSVTDRCDLRCQYCMPEQVRFLPRKDLLTIDELHDVARAFVMRGVTKLRITGGEPLVRPGAMDLMARLGALIGNGLDELTLTTNATQLKRHAADLAACGVRRINVSLDTLDRDTFARLARRDVLHDVLAGIDAAAAAGIAIKINTVALKGTNEAEIPALVEWAHARGHTITLIEVMPVGDVGFDRIDQFLPLDAVRAELSQRWTLAPSDHATGGPARYYDVEQTGGRIGFISPLTQNFCAGCNRMRVGATGRLFACLGGEDHVDLRTALRDGGRRALDAAINSALRTKPERHGFAIGPGRQAPAVARHMSATGG
jgi:cyclic pyranopterin phosphate synthase